MDPKQVRENRTVWERIADSFHSTRNKPWRTIDEFSRDLPPRRRVLDAGCGNGRHARLLLGHGHEVVGLDLSRRLLLHARRATERRAEWVEGVVEALPFRDGSFDAVLAIAVLHHVRGRRQRVATLQEWLRVLRPDGRILVSGWSLDQPRFRKGPLRVPAGPTEGGDHIVKWTHHGLDVDRYIHLYTWKDWREEMDETHARIERIWPEAIQTEDEPDNFFAIIRRR